MPCLEVFRVGISLKDITALTLTVQLAELLTPSNAKHPNKKKFILLTILLLLPRLTVRVFL